DAVPDRLSDRGAPTGLGRRDTGALAPSTARPRARPPPAPVGDERARGVTLVGRALVTALRDPRVRPSVGCASRPRPRHRRGGVMRVAILAPPWFAVPPSGY